MKKNLLITVLICFGYFTFAQVNQLTPTARYNEFTMPDDRVVVEPSSVHEQEINPYVSSLYITEEVIGETYYDLQSNSSMANRIWTFDDGTIGAVWTMSHETANFPACPDRGTGYNYFNLAGWGPFPQERVEEARTGWPSYAPYGPNGEIVCSHRFNDEGFVFSWRENKGEGTWNSFTMTGPPGFEFIAWPRMITSGENNEVIHVIANVPSEVNGGGIYEGLDGAVVYSRSDDGGVTWDPSNEILEGMGSDYSSGWPPDDYAWATSKGEVLAFVAFDGITDGVIMKSEDGGDTWERITFYESPDPFFNGDGGDLSQCGGGDGYNALAIDNEGMVHVVFGRQIHLDDTPDDGTWSYFPFSDGLVYWNETMPPLDTAQITAEIIPEDWSTHPLYLNGQLAAWSLESPDGDTLSNIAPYFASLTSMPAIAITEEWNGDDILQVFYSGVTAGYVRPDEALNNYRHIWGRFTEMDGNWSDFTDYTGDIFHLFKESAYPSVSQNVMPEGFDIVYQSDDIPGTALQPDPPTHGAVLNEIIHLMVPPPPIFVEDHFSVNFEVSQNHPNPAVNETWVMVTTEKRGQINFTVSNLLGQVVYKDVNAGQTLGANTFRVDVSSFESGIYLYTVEIGGKAVTKKMLVKSVRQ